MSSPVIEQPELLAPTQPFPPPAPGLDVRTITESALLMDVTVLLALLRVLLPIPGLQGLIRLACPIPFVLLALRRGTRAGLVATVASCVLLSTFVGPLLAVEQLVVFGGLGTLFAWASKRRLNIVLVVVVGATLYGVLYLLPPFLFSLAILKIDLGRTLHDVQHQANGFLLSFGHLRLLGFAAMAAILVASVLALVTGSVSQAVNTIVFLPFGFLGLFLPIGPSSVAGLSRYALGRTLLDTLHGAALVFLTHPLATFVLFFAAYSLINVWAYLVVSIELYRRLPPEARRDAQGAPIDFFRVG